MKHELLITHKYKHAKQKSYYHVITPTLLGIF